MKTIYDPTHLGLQIAKWMGTEVQVFCPFHSDSNPSAEYSLTKGVFYCFGCHEGRSSEQLAAELGGALVPMAFLPDFDFSKRRGKDLDWLDFTKCKIAVDNRYLKERLVNNWQIKKYEIRENDNGIIFTMRDNLTKAVGVQMRHYDKQPKYKFYGNRTPVYPMDRIGTRGTIYIVEGIFGMLRADKFRIPTVATMGAASVENVGQYLKRNSPANFVAVMDPDEAGLLAAGKFTLLEIPVILTEVNPDEMGLQWAKISEASRTTDVNDVIARSKNPAQIQKTLEKFWRKLQ